MATCPNKNLDSWNNLVAARGEDIAYYLWDKYEGSVPENESRSSIIKAGIKSVNALQSNKAAQLFSTLEKNKVTGDAFWNKIQSDLQIPKDQIELLKQYNTTDREQLITGMLGDYSYTVEINVAKRINIEVISTGIYTEDGGFDESFQNEETITDEDSDQYSNLTVPGGTNYKENEIATPAITPSIKGHAQFATDKGIGWFRSDDKISENVQGEIEFETYDVESGIQGEEIPGTRKTTIAPKDKFTYAGDVYEKKEPLFDEEDFGTISYFKNNKPITSNEFYQAFDAVNQPTKTRRILEVQSDLFQKGRDKINLVEGGNRVPESKRNQFLQLLNKANNWVTFFVKSIIQDSAKKGYEKVVFPTKETIVKIESSEQLTWEGITAKQEIEIPEGLKWKVENEGKTFKELIENKKWIKSDGTGNTMIVANQMYKGKKGYYAWDGNTYFHIDNESDERTDIPFNEFLDIFNKIPQYSRDQRDKFYGDRVVEISQHERDTYLNPREGGQYANLVNTAKFYENDLLNVLKKQGYAPKQVTDENGNTWNEVSLVQERDTEQIYFQLDSAENAMSNLSILDSIINKLGMFNPYFRRNDVDITLKQKLLEMGLTQYEISYLEALDKKSPKDRLNFSVLIANEYSKHLQSNLLETRLMRLKKMEANKELDNQLLEFLAPMGVRLEELDSLKERFGTDAFGIADILYRVIYASKNRKLDSIAEEVAHFYVEMMGIKEGLGEKLMDKIEGWSEYPKIYAEYSSVYLTREGQPDVAKIKKEAIGKAIAEAIIKQYASRSENIPQGERSFWQEVLSLIEKIRAIFQRSANYKPLEVITDEIATKIFNKDYSDTLERIQSVKQKNRELKTYEGTLASIPKVKSVIDKIISLGGVLTGSLALRYQGELYRNESEKIHDLDFSIDYNVYQGNWEKFVEDFKKVFPNYRQISKSAFPGNSGERVLNGLITNNDALYEKFMSLPGDFNSRLDQFTLEEQEQMLLVDFFFNPEGFTTPNVRGLQSADAIFSAKSSMGMRPKDAFDLVNFKPYTGTPSQLSSYSYAQMGEMPMSTASKETLDKVKQVLKKMGVSIEALSEYLKGNPNVNATTINGVADLVRGVIAIAEGKEDVALTEEMVHVATAILEQTNPKLVTEMISKIDRFEIYQKVLAAYKNNKAYQLPNGKPNIRKIKKEAVDKLIAELIINKNEGKTEFPELMQEANRSMVRNWWNAITDFFRGMYKKSNIKIFEEAADIVSSGEVGGTIGDIKNRDVFYQLTEAQEKRISAIRDQEKNIDKIVEKKEADPLLLDSEEANNFYRVKLPNGKIIEKTAVKRVTDRVKAWYKKRFGDKKFTEIEKKFNNLKRDFGIKYHGFFEEIHNRYFNSDGTKKSVPGDRPYISDTVDSEVYDKIEKYYTELIGLLPEGTAVLSEVKIFDPKQKEAGTIDFLAIDKDGKAHILDWKFMYISPDSKTDDVAWFKQGAYNIQLGRYKEMLRDAYGFKEFGMIRAVPFLMKFEKINPKDKDSDYIMKGISAGSADKTKIENLKLMPVSEETESTGNEQLDKLLKKLNALLKQYTKEKVTDESEREYKIERLNTIRRAMRVVQGSGNLAPLIDVIEVMRKDGERILEDYEVIYKDKISTREDFNDKVLSDFSEDMTSYLNSSEIFTNISALIGDSIYNKKMLDDAKTEEEKETVLQLRDVLLKLREEQEEISRLRLKIDDASKKFADKHIGQRNLVAGLLNEEAIINGLGSLFRGVSELPTAALRLLYKVTQQAKGKAMAESLGEVEQLMALRKKLADRGGDLRALVQKIYQKDDKGGFVNKLIRKYQKEFYTKIKELAEEGGDRQWLMDNIDIEEYKKEALAKLEEQIDKLKRRRFPGTAEEEQEAREEAIIQERRKWDITRKDFNGWNNSILKKHPKEKWLTKEYLDIRKDADLLNLYNFITKFNDKSKEVGYLNNVATSTFLPFIRKGTAEQLVWNNSISAVANFRDNLKMNADDVGYGQYDELTGELENSIPKYYTHDFSKREDGPNDYSDVSEDLFKNMILYIQSVNKYKYLSEVEGQIQLIKTVERFKGNLITSRAGDVVKGPDNTTAGNNKNARFFDDFMKALLYDQKYSVSDAEVPLYIDKVLNLGKKIVNKVAGKEVWKEGDAATPTSLVKTMDAANRAFQLKVLGLNPISGLANAFGGNIQVATQAGNYFEAGEFFKNQAKLSVMKFRSKEEETLFLETQRLFMPLKDDPSAELFKKAGMSIATRGSASDFLMMFMSFPEKLIEKSIFETLLQNTMVENGRIVNIREFVKNKYKGRSNSSAAYREAKQKISAEVEQLKKTRSIAVTRKMENGKLVIPGLDLKNQEELLRFTNLTRRISRNATGGISDGDINRMSQNVWTRSMMVFRQWIPKLADTRFSEFRKTSDDFSVYIDDEGQIQGEKYDIGRIRLLGVVLADSITSFSNNISNILSMNEKGVEAIDKMYEEFARKYEQRTGQPLNMSKDDFTDMVITNLRNQIRELIVLASLLGASLSMGFIAPDDEDDRATKNAFRYAQRTVDRFVDELSFFYNPANFEQVLSGSAFPVLGLLNDFKNFTSSFFKEITGFDFMHPTKTSEEVRKDALPIKYLIKNFPAGNQTLTFLSIFSDEFAKDYDITIQRETKR